MTEVERLSAAAEIEIEELSPDSADAVFCLSEYFRELAERFESGFDPAQSLAPTLQDFAPPKGMFLVMRLHGRPVGCGGFKPSGDAAYIKRMWVAADSRGLGLARRLLEELEHRAHALGYRLVQLETEKSLSEAQQLYRKS